MLDATHLSAMERIFRSLDPDTLKLATREGTTVEFKETFNWGNNHKYAKSMAAFANNRGGYLVFGVSDAPRHLVGLQGQAFDSLDEAKVTGFINSIFSPELQYEKFSHKVFEKRIGVIYVPPHDNRPVVATKNTGDIKEAAIYYRYNARNDNIRYPELKALFEKVRDTERQSWMELFRRVSKIGPENAAIMDVVRGSVEGSGGSLLIDASLLPKLKFIREGHLADSGKPVLKLVGEVVPVAVTSERNRPGSTFRITDDPNAPAVREDTLLDRYPLSYRELTELLVSRYTDFKLNEAFHKIRRPLKQNPKYCHTRYLDPRRKRSGKDFYSHDILREFDKHYTKRK